jgi:hypothetical protein
MASGFIPPREEYPPVEQRDALRAEELAKLPQWYNPVVRLAVPSVFAVMVIVASIALLKNPAWWQWLAVPVFWAIANAEEWHLHRDLFHYRHPFVQLPYDRHTLVHHTIYVADDMAMRSRREFGLVLIPIYGIFVIFLTAAPVAALGWIIGLHNLALLYLATVVGWAASYEWLHLSYHFPPESWIGRLPLIGFLRRHHAIHHDPRLMQRYNFNVTVPLWDWVKGTLVVDRERALAERRSKRTPAGGFTEPAAKAG